MLGYATWLGDVRAWSAVRRFTISGWDFVLGSLGGVGRVLGGGGIVVVVVVGGGLGVEVARGCGSVGFGGWVGLVVLGEEEGRGEVP